jgi:hypothetical protein
MTSRERFRRTMDFGRPDRVPWLEEGLRDDVVRRWRRQGLGARVEPAAVFEYDLRERIELDLGPRPRIGSGPLCPADLPVLRRRLDSADPARLGTDWVSRVQGWRHREHILELPLHHGLFLTLGVGDWTSLEKVLYMLADEPRAAAGIMRLHGRLAAELADRVLGEVDVDFASFSEPIGGNNGPMISSAMYRRIVLDSYAPIIDVLRRRGVRTIVYITYANARALLRDVVAAGFNALWAIEADSSAMDYLAIRREFGPALRLIGGIDLDWLMEPRQELERQMRRVVPPLLAEGGYIPLADGRVRASVPFAHYRAYRRLLEELTA